MYSIYIYATQTGLQRYIHRDTVIQKYKYVYILQRFIKTYSKTMKSLIETKQIYRDNCWRKCGGDKIGTYKEIIYIKDLQGYIFKDKKHVAILQRYT